MSWLSAASLFENDSPVSCSQLTTKERDTTGETNEMFEGVAFRTRRWEDSRQLCPHSIRKPMSLWGRVLIRSLQWSQQGLGKKASWWMSFTPGSPSVDGFKRLWMDRFEGCAARILKNENLKLYLLRKLLLNLWKMSLWTVYTSWIEASDLWMFFRVTERALWEVGGHSQLLERSRCGWWKREGDCARKTYSRTALWGWTVSERRHHLPQYGRGTWLRNFQGCKFILFLTYFQHGTRLIKQWTLSERQISAYRDRTVLFCRFWRGLRRKSVQSTC